MIKTLLILNLFASTAFSQGLFNVSPLSQFSDRLKIGIYTSTEVILKEILQVCLLRIFVMWMAPPIRDKNVASGSR